MKNAKLAVQYQGGYKENSLKLQISSRTKFLEMDMDNIQKAIENAEREEDWEFVEQLDEMMDAFLIEWMNARERYKHVIYSE